MLLLEIRGKTISYASFKQKENSKKESQLMNDIKLLENALNDQNVHILEQKRQELVELRQKKVNGMIVRSRARWIQDGENNSKYFL